jgi:hypothetical protein
LTKRQPWALRRNPFGIGSTATLISIYESRKEIISAPHTAFSDGKLPGVIDADGELVRFEDRWTGSYIFENE